jgi:hypothetical protein
LAISPWTGSEASCVSDIKAMLGWKFDAEFKPIHYPIIPT